MKNKSRSGQVGLLLLVIMGVVVALVMSVASRSLSDTVLSRQERESSAAFAVAESGIEDAMNALRNPGQTQIAGTLSGLSGFVSGNYAVTNSSNYGLFVREGEAAHLDLSGFSGNLVIMWTKQADPTEKVSTCTEGSGSAPAAIEVSAISATTVNRTYYNPAGAGCSLSSNGFESSSEAIGTDYLSKVDPYVVSPGTTMLRIKPIYAGATISVNGSGLQNQLYLIQSKAIGGDARKEIEVKRGLDAPASIFDYAVFSASTIVK